MPYEWCWSRKDISKGYDDLGGKELSIRTDVLQGDTQGYNLPFLYCAKTKQDCLDFYDRVHEDHFSYILCHSVTKKQSRHNCAAFPIDDECLMVEFDNGGQAQREWEYLPCTATSRIACGPYNQVIYNNMSYRCYKPEDLYKLGLERLYKLFWQSGCDELIWTITKNGKVVIW